MQIRELQIDSRRYALFFKNEIPFKCDVGPLEPTLAMATVTGIRIGIGTSQQTICELNKY